MAGKLWTLLLLIILSCSSLANPWIPSKGGWKYNFSYSKYDTPRTIKFYEKDLYFLLEKAKALEYRDLSKINHKYKKLIDERRSSIFARQSEALDDLKSYLKKSGLDTPAIVEEIQEAKTNRFDQDQNIQIYYKRIENIKTDTQNHIKHISDLQKHLILSYHKWNAKTNIEYGLNNNISFGMNISRTKEVDKYKTNITTDETEVFVKTKLYDKKGYIFTIQPKIINGPIEGVDFTAMLGKSHSMERKIFDKPIELFGYSAFGITYFLDHPILKQKMHAEITSGIKYNDRTIIMNQESEDFNPQLGKIYKRVVRSQFTIAQDLNFANIEPRNKVYLTLSYFTIDSMKSHRHLSSGYSIGLWLEL